MIKTTIKNQPENKEPRLAATIIVVKEGADGLKVLLMQRNLNASFLAGFWVFPGGVVEPEDEGVDHNDTVINAAVRETVEEAGLQIDKSQLLPVSRWITPETIPKRFDTYFFLAPVVSSDIQIDGEEIIDAVWVSPAEAIKRHQSGGMDMMPPTLVSCMALNRFTTERELVEYYQTKNEQTVFTPKPLKMDGKTVILYPGDSEYEEGEGDSRRLKHRCIFSNGHWHYENEVGA